MEKTPIITTVAFVSTDKAAFDEFWTDIRTRYKFCDDDKTAPTRAFAVNMGDLFAQNEALDEILNSRLADYEKLEAIAELDGHDDPAKVLAEWGIVPLADRVGA